MRNPKPNIKFNDGNPVALCNRCFVIMCQVSCTNIKDINTCIITSRLALGDEYQTSEPIGSPPPLYCNACTKLLNYTLNE